MKQPFGILALSGIFFFSQFSLTSAQQIEWQNTIGGSYDDRATFIMQTGDGGYICGGSSASFVTGDKTDPTNGFMDYWVMKLDGSGNIQWQNSLGGTWEDYLTAIDQTADGGYICGGRSSSNISGDKTENCFGQEDYWIVKLDASGVVQWENTIGGSNNDYLYDLEQTTDGGYILGGWSESDISGDKNENSIGSSMDYWIIKLDSTGNIQWQNTIGGSAAEKLFSIDQTFDGGYILGGYSASGISGDKTETNYLFDYWIIKLNAFGGIEWQNTIGGSEIDYLYSIAQTSDGGYIAGGGTYSSIGIDQTENCLYYDCWVLKLDSIGNIEWQNTFGGTQLDYVESIQPTSDGGYICAAQSNSGISGDKTEACIGDFDYWLVKLDSGGNIEWQNTIGGTQPDFLNNVIESNDGNYVLAGYSLSDISGDKTENSNGDEDFWIVKAWGNANKIFGEVYADMNSNNIRDAGEVAIPYNKISEANTGRFTFSGNDGSYCIGISDSGNYVVEPLPINYYSPSPAIHSVYFSGFIQSDSSNNFAFQPTGTFNDLSVTLTPLGPFRSGFQASYSLEYRNTGTTSLNATVVFYNDQDLTYSFSIPAATSVTSDSVVYSLGTLAPFQNGQIFIEVNVVGLPADSVVSSGAVIFPIINDVTPTDNVQYAESLITGAFDPNDIHVNIDTLYDYQMASPPFLEYTIRFQNTGNDTAFNVRIENKIEDELQLNTFEYLASSHACNIEYQPYDSTMKYIFNNILLPDSNINEIASHGFIKYRIKPKSTLTVSDSITNTTGIIFDYNVPVITNTAVTHIVTPSGLSEIENNFVKTYPNPASDKITVALNTGLTKNLTVELFNIFSQKINQLYAGHTGHVYWERTFDVASLSPGMYIIKISGDRPMVARFIKK